MAGPCGSRPDVGELAVRRVLGQLDRGIRFTSRRVLLSRADGLRALEACSRNGLCLGRANEAEFLLSAVFFAIVGAIAAANLGLFSRPLSLMLLALAVLSAALLWFGIMLFMSAGAAWLSRARALKFGVWSFDEHTKYPLDILPFPLQVGLTVVPYAFTSYYPISLALRPDTHIWPGILSLPVGLAVAAISLLLYNRASSHYDSLGSADPTY